MLTLEQLYDVEDTPGTRSERRDERQCDDVLEVLMNSLFQ